MPLRAFFICGISTAKGSVRKSQRVEDSKQVQKGKPRQVTPVDPIAEADIL
jgi:hypothetical protein